MTPLLLQELLAALLLVASIRHETTDALKVFLAVLLARQSISAWLEKVMPAAVRLALAALGTACLVDPVISGTANFSVRAPTDHQALLDNLRVRITPVGATGPAGGNRNVVARFDAHSIAVPIVTFEMFEVSARIEVFDITQSEQPALRNNIVYVSPITRRQLRTQQVEF